MPKKSATTRGAAQRNKPKVQKSFEVVRQTVAEQEPADNEQDEEIVVTSIPTPATETRPSKSATKTATRVAVATPEVETVEESDIALTPVLASEENSTITPTTRGGSASARLAARRGQKAQQRTATALITAEHYGYVRRDLTIIAILASVMFIAIIVLYFTIGRGA